MRRMGEFAAVLMILTLAAPSAYAAANKVVIGDIDDMSGLYADVIGPGGVEAAKMAIEDFGGQYSATRSSSWSPTIKTSLISAHRSFANGPTAMV